MPACRNQRRKGLQALGSKGFMQSLKPYALTNKKLFILSNGQTFLKTEIFSASPLLYFAATQTSLGCNL
jgi:hypothetical protein